MKTALGVWVTNHRPDEALFERLPSVTQALMARFHQGPPKASATYTVAQLERMGYVGFYTRRRGK